MKHDKVDWCTTCRIKPRLLIDIPLTALPFQDDEVEEHLIHKIDDVITPLRDSNGVFVDVDDGHDDVNLEDAVEPYLEATDVVDDEDGNMSNDSDY